MGQGKERRTKKKGPSTRGCNHSATGGTASVGEKGCAIKRLWKEKWFGELPGKKTTEINHRWNQNTRSPPSKRKDSAKKRKTSKGEGGKGKRGNS